MYCNQVPWYAFQSMSGFDASFLLQVAIVSRHTRTVYKTRMVCLLFPEIASSNGCEVMISPNFIAFLKRIGVG